MIAAVILVSLTYVLPFAAVYLAGVPAAAFSGEGAWAQVAGLVGGTWHGANWLGFLLVMGGMVSAFGVFNALVMGYSRLPLVMAQDGLLAKALGKTHLKTGAAWVAFAGLETGWGVCVGLGFWRLVTL